MIGRNPVLWKKLMHHFTFFLLNLDVLKCATALPQTAAPLFHGKPFVVIWNAPVSKCQQLKVPLILDSFQDITTPARVQNQTLTLLYKKRLGLFPYTDTDTLTQYAGGIPQKGNLNASLFKSKEEFTQYISVATPGLAVLDWEEWLPVFDRNIDLKEIYKILSINFTLQQEPLLTYDQATSKAREQFNKAAQAFMEKTLKLAVTVRPRTLWGYYLFPDCYNYDFENPDYTGKCSLKTTQLNTELQWLWNTSSALYPSAYVPASLSGTQKAMLFVRNQVLEAIRVASLSQKNYTIPVYLYLRPILRGTKEKYMQEVDLIHSIGESAALGAAGCVLWGSSYDFNNKISCESLASYLYTTLNPYIINVTTAAQLCSDLLCRGNGRCVRRRSDSPHFLHLNINNFSIHRTKGKYRVSGKPTVRDLAAWAHHFTCQCYEDKICSTKAPPSKSEHWDGCLMAQLTVLLSAYLLL